MRDLLSIRRHIAGAGAFAAAMAIAAGTGVDGVGAADGAGAAGTGAVAGAAAFSSACRPSLCRSGSTIRHRRSTTRHLLATIRRPMHTRRLLCPAQAKIRKSLGEMMRKLSDTSSQ
jgi:hypothetical protein